MLKNKVLLLLVMGIFLQLGLSASEYGPQGLWDHKWKEIGKNIVQVNFSNAHYTGTISPKNFKALCDGAKNIKVLDNPDSRSLPQVEGMIVLFLKNNNMLVLQMVKDHWFKGVYFESGQVIPFILKDTGNAFHNSVTKICDAKQKKSK